jgi:thioesterase domain-containing protein
MDGRLQMKWTYSGNMYSPGTIETLAQRFLDALRSLIDHCLSPGAGGYTPSDFPGEVLKEQRAEWSPLVPMQARGTKRPFFCVHPAGGNVLCYQGLAHYLGDARPFYGLEARGLAEELKPYTSIEEMASHYLKAVLSIQSEGPYLLGGWSFGGTVAFEMAQQLLQKGQKVAMLALIDGWSPVQRNGTMDIEQARILANLAKILGQSYRMDVSLEYEDLKRLKPNQQIDYFIEKIKSDMFPPDVGRRYVDVYKTNMLAHDLYAPNIYPGPVALFKADMIDHEVMDHPALNDPTQGWQEFSAEPLEIHVIPGSHGTLMEEPHVKVLADKLRTCLDNVQ